MSDTQLPKALQLAENVVSSWAHGKPPEWAIQTAAELRRLHAELAAAKASLAAQGEPVASIYVTSSGYREIVDWKCDLPAGRNILYTAPPAPAKPMTREQAMAIVQSNPDTMTAIRMTEAHHGITDKGGA